MLPRADNTCIMCCTPLLHGGNKQVKNVPSLHPCCYPPGHYIGAGFKERQEKSYNLLQLSFTIHQQQFPSCKDFDPYSSKMWQELTIFFIIRDCFTSK